ncbi:MAG: helix-turn-helix domain-containing protein [Peptococcaceae bacterium]|nr:helix-turn-helix domain-containing protein [Peptococcaceae bacterium]
MASVGSRIKDRRKQLGLTVDEVAMKLGKNRATVYRYESNDIENMPATVLEPLAEILDTTPAFLLGYDTTSNVKIADVMSITNIIPLPQTKKVPLLGSIACGEPITAVENIDSYVDMPDEVVADFALTCRGDSMIDARIYDGDIVYIREQPEVENGEIAAVLIDGEATLKKVYYQKNKIILQPENKKYEPLVYVAEEILDVRILGKAVYFLSKVRT